MRRAGQPGSALAAWAHRPGARRPGGVGGLFVQAGYPLDVIATRPTDQGHRDKQLAGARGQRAISVREQRIQVLASPQR